MDAKQYRGSGKSDRLDAHRIAAAVLPLSIDKPRQPRLNNGIRQAIQVLLTARTTMNKDRTRAVNALTALLRTHDLGIDARNN